MKVCTVNFVGNGIKYQEVVLLSGLMNLVFLLDWSQLLGITNLKCTKQHKARA